MQNKHCLREFELTFDHEKITILMHLAGSAEVSVAPPHKHLHTEIQLIVSGRMEESAEDKCFTLTAGDMAIIPPNHIHENRPLTEDSRWITFRLTKPLENVDIMHPGTEVVTLLDREFAISAQTGDYRQLKALLTLVCCKLPGIRNESYPHIIQNREYLLDYFLTYHYHEDISLTDVARWLNVSEKYAIRLVQEYTGHNFRTELRNRRLEAAGYLMENTDMTMTAIAERVGYRSYNGFLKALKNTKTSFTENTFSK